MVTIKSMDREFASSTVFAVTAVVSGARNHLHAFHMVEDELTRTGWTVDTERYEAAKNEDGTHTITLY